MNLANEQLSKKEMEEINGGLYLHIGKWGFEIRKGGICSFTCMSTSTTEGGTDNANGNLG